VDARAEWLQSKPGYTDAVAAEYRSRQITFAVSPVSLFSSATVLISETIAASCLWWSVLLVLLLCAGLL